MVDALGAELASPPLNEMREFQRLGGNLVYSPEHNGIFDAITGDVVWKSVAPSHGYGAVAGNFVFFASEATVRAQPR